MMWTQTIKTINMAADVVCWILKSNPGANRVGNPKKRGCLLYKAICKGRKAAAGDIFGYFFALKDGLER